METVSPQTPTRVGVILADLHNLNITALKYLVVHLNTLQSSIEFELLAPDPNDPLLVLLAQKEAIDRETAVSPSTNTMTPVRMSLILSTVSNTTLTCDRGMGRESSSCGSPLSKRLCLGF